MANVLQKSEKISAFDGIFSVLDKFDRILSSVIDSHLGLRSTLTGYQYSEIIRAVKSTIRQHRPKQGLNQTIEKLSADFRVYLFN